MRAPLAIAAALLVGTAVVSVVVLGLLDASPGGWWLVLVLAVWALYLSGALDRLWYRFR